LTLRLIEGHKEGRIDGELVTRERNVTLAGRSPILESGSSDETGLSNVAAASVEDAHAEEVVA
jgi:hypothetical protein